METLNIINQKIQKWFNINKSEKLKKNTKPKNLNNQIKDEDLEGKSRLFCLFCKIHSPVMLVLTLTSLIGVVSYRFYNQPELAVNTISPEKIIAPSEGSFEDFITTEELRKQTRNGLLPILKKEQAITNNINIDLAKQLDKIEQIRAIVANIPLVEKDILSKNSQQYLHQLKEEEWQIFLTILEKDSTLNSQISPQTKTVIEELKKYPEKENKSEFANILNKIKESRQKYQQAKNQSFQTKIGELKNQQKEILINLPQDTWEKTKITIQKSLNRILTQGIPPGLPEQIKSQTILIQLDENLPQSTKLVAFQLLFDLLQPNLQIDEEETKIRAEKAAQQIEPVMVSIKKGQLIVDLGEEITQREFVLLDGFNLSRRSINFKGIAVSALFVSTSLLIFLGIVKQIKGKLRRRDQILLWLLTLITPFISIFDARYASLPAVGFLLSSFYGPTLAISNVTLITGLVIFQTEALNWDYMVSSYAGAIFASIVASRLHSREELAFFGAGVGLIQGGVYLVINLILGASAGTIWYAVLPGAIIYGLIGVAGNIIALGISPYLERCFDLVTPIRLAELSNPNRPLLKRLSQEAPGTFQHTLFVASLAETAARELGCNVELVRAGTLYHDIGKMHDPKSFIENQMGGANKHDQINDPVISAKIIKKHVSEGLVMAREYNLPKAIQNFIPEHQGNLLISYFYFQAKNNSNEKDHRFVDENDFRYDGPIPQSRETAIVMLADSCEAALRSLKDATPDKALAMIQKIFKARWRDEQLVDSGLKYEELPIIAEIFVRVWQQSNHQRIAYPKGAL